MPFRVISQDIEDTLNPRRVRVFLVSGQVVARWAGRLDEPFEQLIMRRPRIAAAA
jgi:hypothetical protein